MKMLPAHQAYIKAAITPLDTDAERKHYIDAGLSDKKYHWDLLCRAWLLDWCCDNLYSYLSDDHIETALRSIIKPLTKE